ncbi:DNA excision repair protein ercc-6 [Chrysochromulina tobinii]|uniref:DNA excision repair protein ercc-6 n=1 Tax=Chrysochromulina tobinii TaxID=1460289 RepID=A0A0M0J8J8_9EUKA|nr:DNA excision repair protein ercc-6 [Chrysochromulina tobinii]|eukprot:KOO22805.1 DNA excision repair protein ercc-6 [Chrysochromulina sp. CCMP291]
MVPERVVNGVVIELDEDGDDLEEGEIAECGKRARRGAAAASGGRRTGSSSGGRRHGKSQRQQRRERTARLDKSLYTESDDETEDHALPHGLVAPGRLWKRLFEHQRLCLEWLCGLHDQHVGGIIGDEMGLGKTLQVISLIASLHHSERGGPCLIVAPATVLRQWQREFRNWAPELMTVAILHSSGGADQHGRVAMVRDVCRQGLADGGGCSVLITSYEMMRVHAAVLLAQRWLYVVLDEGHKIRNPDAEITLVAKRFNTGHRLILTGAPIQNKLAELWSLFDFVYPGKLGTLPMFEEQFALPISQGAYANASNFKVQAAFQCSLVLRDLIRPYLLRRTKVDVQLPLPSKSEQVLFCQLTEEQRDVYERFLRTDLVQKVLQGRANAFAALSSLLKVCNHPHLLTWLRDDDDDLHGDGFSLKHGGGVAAAALGPSRADGATHYGDWKLSGKMVVMRQILLTWQQRGDRALIFCQTKQMLDIVQGHVLGAGYTFRRLDGSTPVGVRLQLIDEFNSDDSIFLFLLTTRAGGLGINLTGANRVLLVDPDWNPANDMQARERAHRMGQKRAVTIYRLVTSGTLEEKVYQRQIFKQFLSSNVLTDPKQMKRVFKPRDLRDLLAPPATMDSSVDGTETGDLFAHAETTAAQAAGGSTFFSQGKESDGRQVGSAALLSRIRERQEAGATATDSPDAAAARLLRRLDDFFAARHGKCTSEQLVKEFADASVDRNLLKALLKQLAHKDDRGNWVLKPHGGGNRP